MRIGIWHPPGNTRLVRAYLNEIPGLPAGAKAYVQPSGEGVSLRVTGSKEASVQAQVLSALVDAGIMGTNQSLAELPFALFEERASGHAPMKLGRHKVPGSSVLNRDPARSKPGTRQPDADALDLGSIKVPEPVYIRIDHREPDELIETLSLLPNVNVERTELALGDIEIQGKDTLYVIERKSCAPSSGNTDFEASVTQDSKRLFFQSEKMRLQEGITPIVLLEGEVHENSRGMLVQAIDGMLSFLVSIQKMNLITTYSLHHTAYFVLKLATHDRSGLGYEPPLRGKKPTKQNREDQLTFVLQGLPGVSSNLARLLAGRFGSLAALTAASREDLLSIPGMGPGRVEKLIDILHGPAGIQGE